MVLRRKVLAAIIVTLSVLTVLFYGLARVSVLQGFAQVEADLARQNIDRVVLGLNSEIDSLNKDCIDYAYWIDTYNFIEDKNRQYLEENYDPDATTIHVDLVLIIDNQGNQVFEQTLLDPDPALRNKPIVVAGDPTVYAQLRQLAFKYSGRAGVVKLNDRFWIVSFQPIFKGSNTTLPSRGYLIFANPIESKILPKIQETTKLDVSFLPIEESDTLSSTEELGNVTSGEAVNVSVNYPNDQLVNSGADYIGLTNQPVIHLHVNSERSIYKQGMASLWYMIWGALAVGLLTSLLGYAIFEMLVMQPVMRLESNVRAIADAGDLSERIETEGSGEFFVLANNINNMLDGLEQAQRSLLESEERFRMMVESAPEAIVVVDTYSGHCVEVNEKALHLFGYQNREEFFQRSVYDLLSPVTSASDSSDAYVKRQAERALSGVTVEFETTIQCADQNVFPCEVRFVRFPGEERRLLRATVTDISERKQSEDRVLQAQKLESLGLLAGGVAHDFNNLLTGMMGQTSLALRKLPDDSPARNHISKAMSSAERASIMTRQLLAYAGRGTVHFELIDLNKLVDETTLLLETALPKHIKLSTDLAKDLSGMEADLGQLQQVVMNLVINAAEAIPEEKAGKISIATMVETLHEGVDYQIIGGQRAIPGKYVCLQVTDNGTGIDKATLQRIFDPFFTTKPTGNGLGLAATLGVVRRHNGLLQVHSQVGQGTEFRLFFPAKDRPVLEGPIVTLPKDSEVSGIVLVIDDEQPVRETVRDILESSGIFVIDAENGRRGIDHFTRYHDEIDVVIIDMQMPLLNGTDTLKALREIQPDVKVILSSGYSESEPARNLLRNEHTLFLPKPYDSENLLGKVYQLIKFWPPQ